MDATAAELLLALRSPRSGWLAAMICTLDEASQDADFEGYQRKLLGSLLAKGEVPTAVAYAAADRLAAFEHTMREAPTSSDVVAETGAPVRSRPKLTICGGVA
ncbi:MAG: hypothetical protein WBV61_02300 [Rhodanobacteraceae bacterium]